MWLSVTLKDPIESPRKLCLLRVSETPDRQRRPCRQRRADAGAQGASEPPGVVAAPSRVAVVLQTDTKTHQPSGDPPTGPSRPRAPLCSALRGRHRHSITLCESPDLLSPPHVPPTHAKKRGRGVTTLLCSLEQAQRFINQTHSNTKSSAKTYRGKRRHYNLSLRLRLRLRLRRLHLRQLVQREVVRRNA